MKIVECVGCGNMIGANDEDELCSKCAELETLRIKVKQYERALKAYGDEEGKNILKALDERQKALNLHFGSPKM